MRTSLPILVASMFIAISVNGQDKREHPVSYTKLIEALASENPAPTERRGPDLKYPPGYDRKKQERVRRAKGNLRSLGPAAFRSLIDNWGDERYCLTYSVGINGYMDNATVGDMCRIIMYDQIQPFGIWQRTDDDPRDKAKRPSYPEAFMHDQEAATKWLEEHKDKSLFDIQLLVIDWVIERESKSPKDFTDEERAAMRDIRERLVKSKKPMTQGNYYTNDYD